MAADPRFFAASGPIALARLAEAAGVPVPDGANPDARFTGIGPLAGAGPGEVSFLENRRYLDALKATRAAAVLVAPAFVAAVPAGCLALPTPQAYLGFIRIARLFHPAPAAVPGVHPSAVIGPGAVIGEGCEIGPGAVIGAAARIGAGSAIGANVVVGPGVEMGPGCRLHPLSSVSHAILGQGVVLHPGARVGQEGFGFVPTPDGRFETAPQLGRVILGDFVEVGANSCIDRGAQDDTVIGPGTRIDNLVQVGHNVRTGRGCVLVAQAGIAGSVTLGDFVTLAGQAGVAGHIEIGSKARIGAQAGVTGNVAPGLDMLGSPAWPVRETWRAFAALRKLAAADAPKKTG